MKLPKSRLGRRLSFITLLLIVGLSALWVRARAVHASAMRELSPSGRLVEVDGHRMHIHCSGEGPRTVLLETGLGGMSSAWAWVQQGTSRFARVCSYDRAGLGWSEPVPGPRDARTANRQLHQLLASAGIPGPYVMVGHSLGGLHSRLYADDYPDQVSGLVLMDPMPPGIRDRVQPPPMLEAANRVLFALLPLLVELGLSPMRATQGESLEKLPPRAAREAFFFFDSPAHMKALRAEIDAMETTDRQGRQLKSLGDKPLLILSTEWVQGEPNEMLKKLVQANREIYAHMAKDSTRGVLRPLAGTDHMGLATDEAQARLVVEAIREVLDATASAMATGSSPSPLP